MADLAVLLLLALATGSTQASCGNRPGGTRIVGGQEAVPYSWPWQLSLRNPRSHVCGASLITPEWALTAAHCVRRSSDPKQYTLAAGAHDRRNGRVLEVSRVIIHEGFSMGHLKHDIALLRLSRPAILDDKVNTVCLPQQGGVVQPELKCYITGWGRYHSSITNAAKTLRQSQVPTIDHETCAKGLKGYYVHRETMICIGGAGSSACNGDSGGPLVCEEEGGRWVLRGAASWVTSSRCPGNKYSVYARVSSHVDWIKNKIAGDNGNGGGGGGAISTPTPPVCSDMTPHCPSLISLCHLPVYKRFCPKTCGQCS